MTVVTDIREKFEVWARQNGYDTGRWASDHGIYVSGMTVAAWKAWQASRTTFLEEAALMVDRMNEGAGDAASYDNREMSGAESEKMRALSAVANAIRALKGQS